MVCICRSAQTPCTRICQIFATIYDSIVYAGENRIKEYLFFIPLTSMQGESFQNSILQPRTGLWGYSCATNFAKLCRGNLVGATETKKSLRVNLCRKLSHHSTRKDSVSDRKTNTNRLATFGGCNRNRGELYVLQFLHWTSPLCDGQKCVNSKCLAFDLLAASGLANCLVWETIRARNPQNHLLSHLR